MKRTTAFRRTIAVLILAWLSVVASAQVPAPESMSVAQARSIMVSGLTRDIAFFRWSHLKSVDPNSFRFALNSFEFDATGSRGTQHFKFDLATMSAVSVSCDKDWCRVNPQYSILSSVVWDDSRAVTFVTKCSEACVNAAHSFAAALNRLRAFAIPRRAGAAEDFHQQAAAWRAMAIKPPLPEEVRVRRLLAEDAIKNRNPEEAFRSYELGLQQHPTWPEGQFNAALIAADLGFYPEAVEHMQCYLELVPGAPDGQRARDQITVWQYKATNYD